MFYLVCTTADKHSCKKNVFFLIAFGVLFATEEEPAWIRGNVICVALLCLSPCLSVWSKSSQGRGKVTQPLPLAQPASALKLRQAVIINEETWANGQEMQRYWLGRLPCSKPYRLAPAWWPVVSQAAVCRGRRRGGSQGVKPGHHWQLSVTSRPHLKDRRPKTGRERKGAEGTQIVTRRNWKLTNKYANTTSKFISYHVRGPEDTGRSIIVTSFTFFKLKNIFRKDH